MSDTIRLENGKKYTPKNDDPVDCIVHDYHTTWGTLDGLQRVAVAEGLDTTADLPCIMTKSSSQ